MRRDVAAEAPDHRRQAALERFERTTELPMLILALAMIPLLLAPVVADLGTGTTRTVLALDWMLWAIFAVEFGVRLYLAPRRMRYATTHWYDVLIVAIPVLRPLRVLRLLRAARLVAFITRAGWLTRSIAARTSIRYSVAVTGVAIVGSATALVFIEGPDSPIQDIGDALWWAAATVTTVGYGDTYPTSAAGRGIGVALMLVGISVFSLVTANIAAFFLEDDGEGVSNEELLRAIEALEARLDELGGRPTG